MTNRTRCWLEAALGAMSVVVMIVTLAMPDWIEHLFSIAPDGGHGSTERQWATALALAALALLLDVRRLSVRTAHSSVPTK